jgi:hypothetical protein
MDEELDGSYRCLEELGAVEESQNAFLAMSPVYESLSFSALYSYISLILEWQVPIYCM